MSYITLNYFKLPRINDDIYDLSLNNINNSENFEKSDIINGYYDETAQKKIEDLISIEREIIQNDFETFVIQTDDFREEELELISELNINLKKLPSKWGWLTNELIDKYYKFVFGPFLYLNPRLRWEDFKILGFESFLRKLERDKIPLSDLKLRNPFSQEKLVDVFGEDKFKLKINNARKKLEQIVESGHQIPEPKLYSDVINFLNLNNQKIINEEFIPSLNNIIESSPQIKKYFDGIKDKQKIAKLKQRVGLAIRHWIKKNPDLPFKNLTELKKHHKSDESFTNRGLSKSELINLITTFVNIIKKEILKQYTGESIEIIENDDFDKFLDVLNMYQINIDVILKYVMSKSTINQIIQVNKIYEGGWRRTQAKRCLLIIGLAILKCPRYKCLKKEFMALTNLNERQASNAINSYIPLLSELNPNLDFSKWSYESTFYSFSKITEMIEKIGNEKNNREGRLVEPETVEDFNILTEVYSPSLVPLIISCENPEHDLFNSSGNKLQQGHWCKSCIYDLEMRVKDVIIRIVSDIEKLKGKGYENEEILDIIFSKSFLFDFSNEIKRKGFIKNLQIERIIQTISLALLRNQDHYSLKADMRQLTGLSEIQIWRNINHYIPLLGEIFPDINVDKWLLKPNSTISKKIAIQFKTHLDQKIETINEGNSETPLSIEKIRIESVQDAISKSTASRLTHNILGDEFNEYFLTPTNYDRKTFIDRLEKILEKSYHIGTDFVLKLYKLTDDDLSPNEFVQFFYPKASGLIEALEDHVTFRRKDTLTKIKKFIQEYFTGVRSQLKDMAMNIYHDYLNLREKALSDNNIPFDFIYLENRILDIKNSEIQNLLLDFFEGFGCGKYNLEFFGIDNFTKASLLKLKGDKNRSITVSAVQKYFKDNLKYIRSIEDSSLYRLCEICRETNASNLSVNHPKILGRILVDYKKAFAAEIPVWKQIQSWFITGHIDALIFDGSYLIIADYKRNLREIKEGIPQLLAYAALLKWIITGLYPSLRNIKIKCIGFCEDVAVEFDPEVVGPKVLSFIHAENNLRVKMGLNELLTVPSPVNKIRKSLYDELKKVLF